MYRYCSLSRVPFLTHLACPGEVPCEGIAGVHHGIPVAVGRVEAVGVGRLKVSNASIGLTTEVCVKRSARMSSHHNNKTVRLQASSPLTTLTVTASEPDSSADFALLTVEKDPK